MPWKAVSLTVELDLSEGNQKQPEWKTVQLLDWVVEVSNARIFSSWLPCS